MNSDNNSRPPFFPLMIDLKNKHVLIIGGGSVAARRAQTLTTCGALITAISPEFSPDFPNVHTRLTRPFTPSDITSGFTLIVAATNSRETNSLIHSLAHAHNIPVNVCDSQAECDFFFPSLIACDNVAVSVCSAGSSASLTKRLSDKLRTVWTEWVSTEL